MNRRVFSIISHCQKKFLFNSHLTVFNMILCRNRNTKKYKNHQLLHATAVCGRHRRAPFAKARYSGLASGGANQLPAAARAFTPSPLATLLPHPPELSLHVAARPVLCRLENARNAIALRFLLAGLSLVRPFFFFCFFLGG